MSHSKEKNTQHALYGSHIEGMSQLIGYRLEKATHFVFVHRFSSIIFIKEVSRYES